MSLLIFIGVCQLPLGFECAKYTDNQKDYISARLFVISRHCLPVLSAFGRIFDVILRCFFMMICEIAMIVLF